MNRLAGIAKLQGIYWAVTGIWPLLHMYSFLWVTGPKTDLWLVRTVALLLTVIGLVLLCAGIRRNVTTEIKWLGIGGAASMAFIDFYYALQNVIRDVYMLDGVAELLLILLWFRAGRNVTNTNAAHATH
ncbi:hypothetical protein [Pontibacter arcticus]|uniref:Uncharacterized protein n=1 Tax=Pontibacter arcticus TaxID=2080288 RepID=A0A364RGX0_9BACT|nr:hypothetical protein [Pontibacter arcticus]RAU83436.1 hypothetical protein DP923_05515 [Pontibacter arcticus]